MGIKASYPVSLTLGVSLAFCVLAERLPWPLRALGGLPEQPMGARGLAKAPTQPVRF